MYEWDLAFNNLQGLVCHKNNNQPTKQTDILTKMYGFWPAVIAEKNIGEKALEKALSHE